MENLVRVEEALDELGLDREDFMEFLEDLEEFLEESVPQLSAAVDAKNFPEIRAHAHAIKGALANLRFVAGAKVAHNLEKQGLNSVDEELEDDLAKLKDVLEKSFIEVKA
ncbi:Hpt domain-containing protein [Fibrobacterales bacterium]|nr:Hpt domain-containing protein [Fibrobacterales bacterium]